MIPYMIGKLAPNSSHLTRGLVKSVPSRGYFRAVPSQRGQICYIPSPPSIVELVYEEGVLVRILNLHRDQKLLARILIHIGFYA